MSSRLFWLTMVFVCLAGCGTVPKTAEEASVPPTSESSTAPPPPTQAVGQMAREAYRAWQAGDYQAAIAAAERGLRIDRRAPQLYLVLARSYRALSDPDRAREFAQQGLRYTASDTSMAKALRELVPAK